MRAVRVFAAALVSAGAAVVCVTASASADSVTPTTLTLVQADPFCGCPNLVDPSVILTGTLWNAQSNTVVTTPEPVTVVEQVAGTGPWVIVASTQTDATGNFTVSLTNLAAGGLFQAEFSGDPGGGYAASTSPQYQVKPIPSTVSINFTSTPKSPVLSGSTVTLAGKASASDSSSTVPVAGASVTLYQGAEPTSVHGTTGTDGSFSLSEKMTASSTLYVELDPVEPWPYSLYAESISTAFPITVLQVHSTQVPNFMVPARHELHTTFTITGTVQALTGTAWKPAPSMGVAFYYRVLPKGSWVHAGSGRTNSSGAFSWQARPIKLGYLRWQVRVTKTQVGTNVYLASTSGTHDSFFVDRSYVTHVVALHLHGYTDLAAIVQDYPQSGGVTYAQVTGTVYLYYHPRGTSTWRYLSSARTDGQGNVAFARAGTINGYFRIVFPAQGHFLGSSATVYLG